MIKAVLFDFGGVVVSEGFDAWVAKNVDPSSRNKLDDMDRKDDLGEISIDTYHKFLGLISGKDPQIVGQDIIQGYSLHKELRDFIEKLHAKGIKTGIISNFPKEWFYELLNKFQLNKLFDIIVVSSEVELIKPSPSIYQEALKRLQLLPEETIFVDDREGNILGARAVGMHGIVFTNAHDLKQQLLQLGLEL